MPDSRSLKRCYKKYTLQPKYKKIPYEYLGKLILAYNNNFIFGNKWKK